MPVYRAPVQDSLFLLNDVLGVERVDSDRIGNIVRLGVNTYGWTFKNRGEDVPGPMPRLRLTAPSSAIWDYGEGEDLIEGSASEFCHGL